MCAQRLLKIRLVVIHQDWPAIVPSRTLSVASFPHDFTKLQSLPCHLFISLPKDSLKAKGKTVSVWMHGKDSLHVNMAPSEGQVQDIKMFMLKSNINKL